MRGGHGDVITAKNEAELDFNDPNESLPTQNSPSVPLVALSSPSSPGGRRESTFSPTAPAAQLAAIHAAHSSAERDVFRSAIHAGAAESGGGTRIASNESKRRELYFRLLRVPPWHKLLVDVGPQ